MGRANLDKVEIEGLKMQLDEIHKQKSDMDVVNDNFENTINNLRNEVSSMTNLAESLKNQKKEQDDLIQACNEKLENSKHEKSELSSKNRITQQPNCRVRQRK